MPAFESSRQIQIQRRKRNMKRIHTQQPRLLVAPRLYHLTSPCCSLTMKRVTVARSQVKEFYSVSQFIAKWPFNLLEVCELGVFKLLRSQLARGYYSCARSDHRLHLQRTIAGSEDEEAMDIASGSALMYTLMPLDRAMRSERLC